MTANTSEKMPTGNPEVDRRAGEYKGTVLIVAEDPHLIRIIKERVMAAELFPWVVDGCFGDIQVVAQGDTRLIACIVMEYEYVERHQSLPSLMRGLPQEVPAYCLHDFVSGQPPCSLTENLHVMEMARLAGLIREASSHLSIEQAKACCDGDPDDSDTFQLQEHVRRCSFCTRLMGGAHAFHLSESELADYRAGTIKNPRRLERLRAHVSVCCRCSDAATRKA